VKENVMTTNRVHLFGGAILTGALLLGTAGLALAQDPTASPGFDWTGSGGMMGGSGMMDNQAMTGAMGAMHASMTADQLKAMGAMHAKMTASGSGDPADMKAMHDRARTGH
jgi:hypothetical protein